MIMVLFSHRHTKNDVFLVDIEEDLQKYNANSYHQEEQDKLYFDFDILRDCMYKYSKKAQDKYFKYMFEAYFFAKFASSDDGNQYILSKEDMIGEKVEKIESEISFLKGEAIRSLKRIL